MHHRCIPAKGLPEESTGTAGVCRAGSSLMTDYRSTVAIVGIGGIFPDAPDLAAFWDNIRNCRTAFREVPDGRWMVPADSVFDPEPGKADCVYSRRGCFIDRLPSAASLPDLA